MTDVQAQVAEILSSFAGQPCTPALMQSIEEAIPRARGRRVKALHSGKTEISVMVEEPGKATFVVAIGSDEVRTPSKWINHSAPKPKG